PSTERISRSKLNLSATSLASVGSSRSLTIFMTPSSMSALITSPDLRRIFSASSATVTDSPTRTSSRLTSAGGASTAAGAGRGVRRLQGLDRRRHRSDLRRLRRDLGRGLDDRGRLGRDLDGCGRPRLDDRRGRTDLDAFLDAVLHLLLGARGLLRQRQAVGAE